MAEGKVWESEYNGKRYSFDKPLKVNCEIDSGWTAYISEWWRTMYPPNIMGFASRTVSSVTFNWCNGDAEETNSKVLNYETYWTWKNSGDTEEQTGGTIQYSPANSSNYYTRECGQGLIVNEGTPITLYAKVHPLDGSFYENHLLDDSFITAKTIFTLTRLPFVSNVGISGLTPSSFVIYWDEVEHAIGYELHLYLDDEKISTTTVNTNSATYTNLKHDRIYKVGIITNADGVEYASSLESPLVEVTMLPLQKLNPPRNIVLTARTETTLTFVWDEPESVEGLVSYLVRCNGNVTTIDKNVRMVTLTNLIEDQEYTVDFASGGDQIDWSNSDWVSVTATPMREKLVYYNAFTTSEEWIDNEYLYKIPSKTNNTPGNVYTTLLTGWTANTELWSDTTALTPATITIVSKTSTSISISFSTPQTDWGGKYVVGINEGRNYDNPTTTEQPKSNTTKTFNGLTPGSVYTISVGQKVESGNYFALAPATYTIRTMSQANQVENLHVINFAVTSLTFTWDSGGYGSGYDVYFTGTKDTIPTTSSTKVASLNYNTNQYVLNNLTGQSKFYLGVVTVGDGINFTNSDIVTNSDWTLEFVKLSGYTISNTPSGRSITVSWTQPSYGGTPTKYTIYSGINESSMTYVGTASTRSFKISGLSPETWYYIGVVANGDYIYNKDSDMVTIRAKTNALIPLAKPTITLTDSKTRQLTFEWTSVANSDGYLVKSGTTESNLIDLGIRVARTITLTGLEPDTTYYIAVAARATNDGNYKNSDYAVKGGATQPLITLEPPRNITVIDMTPTSIEFSYEAPASTNGLSGYTFYLNGSYYSSKGSGETKTIKFTNLTPDTEYTFGFQSTGDQIIGGDSRKEEVLQTPLSEKLVVSSYYFPGSDSWENNQYEYKIGVTTNSTPGSVMTTVFKGWSAETNSFVYKTALTQTNISISNVDYNSVRVSYSTLETGWAGSYNIKVASGKTFSEENVVTSFTVSNSTNYSDVTNLKEGLMYTVKVCQIISNPDSSSYFVIGDGSVFTFKTKQHIEKATNLTASTIGVTSLTFTWDSATYALGYDVRFKQGQSISMSDPSTVVNEEQKQYTNLTGETYYTIGVVPKGDDINFGDATGMTSYTVKTADLVAHPGATLSFSDVTQVSMVLKWTPTVNDGISGYKIYYSNQNQKPASPSFTITNSATTQQQISGLLTNTTYYFWFVVTGSRVYYKDSNDITSNKSTLAPVKLSAPVLIQSTTTTSSIEVTWSKQSASGHDAVKYRIYYSKAGSSTTSTTETTRLYSVISNLTYNSTYYFWGQSIGDGTYTSDSDVSRSYGFRTNDLVKLAVTLGNYSVTIDSVTINWTVENSPINNFIVYSGTSSQSTAPSIVNNNVASTSRSYTFTGLQPGTTYYFGVQAKGVANQSYDSDKARDSYTTKQLTPLVVKNLSTQSVSAKSMTIQWSVEGSPISAISVQKGSDTPISLSSGTTSYRFTGLSPNTSYTFKVTAIGVAGESSTSAPSSVTQKTISTTALSVTNVTQIASTKDSITVSWSCGPITDGVQYFVFSGTTSNPSSIIGAGLTNTQFSKSGFNSGASFYVAVSAITSNENYTNSSKSTAVLVKTNYVDTSKTVYSLINFSASYNQIPASGTNGNYVAPLSSPAPSAKSVTAYTVVNYNGDIVSGDGYEETTTINKPQLTFSGVPITNRTGLGYDSTTGGVKVDTRAGNYGASDWVVYRIYGLYNGTVSNNYVEVEQQSNTYEYGDYQAPDGASFTTKTVPASAYTITIGKTSTSTIYLNNASSVTQLRYKIYTSGYKDPDNSYKPGSYNITVGAVDTSSLSVDSLGTTPTGETNITVAVWYAANNQTATTNVVLTRSENKITSGSTITITNYSTNSSYNRIEVPASESTFYLQAAGTVKFTSTATRPAIPDDFVLVNTTLAHSRTYTSGTTSNSVSITFGTLGTNTVSSGNTTLTVKYKELTSPTKAVYFKELENKPIGWDLNITWENGFKDTMAWNITSVSEKVNSIDYVTTYSSTEQTTSHPTLDQLTLSTTNSSFSISADTAIGSIVLTTSQNTSTSTDKTTQFTASYGNGTYTSPTITQTHLVTVQQNYDNLQNAYTGSRFSLQVQQNSMTADGWELYIDIVYLKVRFLPTMRTGNYGVRMYVSDGQGFESPAINEASTFAIPSSSGYTTFELDDNRSYVIPGASKDGNFESGGTAQVRFELYSKSTGLVLSGAKSSWYTIDIV